MFYEAIKINIYGMGEMRVANLDIRYSLNTQKSIVGTLGGGEGFITLSRVNGNFEVFGVDRS